MSTTWTLIEPQADIAQQLGLPTMALPIRTERVGELLSPVATEIDIAGIVDELELFGSEQPDSIEALTPSMVRLTVSVVDPLLAAGDHSTAEQYVRRARRWAPRSVVLRVRLGQALHGLGQHGEATDHWVAAVDAARRLEEWSPILWLLTARSLMEQERFEEAARLLDEHLVFAPSDEIRTLRDSIGGR